MSCNLLHGLDVRSRRVDLDAVAAWLAPLEVDVLGLQEVDRGLERSGGVDQAAVLGEALGLHAVFAPALVGDPDVAWEPVPATDPGGPAYGIALLTRAPLRAVQRAALPGGAAGTRSSSGRNPGWDREPRTALTATVELAETLVRVTTAHLSYLPWRGVRQLRDAAGQARGGSDEPALLLGDLNLPGRLVGRVLPGWTRAPAPPTYPSWRPRTAPDQLLVAGGLTILRTATGPAGPSDHLPLVVDVALP